MSTSISILFSCLILGSVLGQKDSETVEDSGNSGNKKNNQLNNEESKSEEKKENDETFAWLANQVEEMEKAREAGDAADLFGTNQHYSIPVNYEDFGRRFVLTYPYVDDNIESGAAEAELDKVVKKHLKSKKSTDNELTPVKAPPEFVLQIAKQSAILEASKPINPTNEVIEKDILRTGEYWDDVRKEEVDVDKILRTSKKRDKLDSIRVIISPGSKLHKLISMLKDRSPRFLYVINKNIKRYAPRFISN